MIDAPPTGLGIAERVALQVHSGTVCPLFGVGTLESLESAAGTGDSVVSVFHNGLLDLGGFDGLGGRGPLNHGTQFDLLGLDPLEQFDLLTQLGSTGLKRPEGCFLLFAHRGGIALGGHLAGGFHFGDHGGQFVEQLLELVHEGTPVCGMRAANAAHTLRLLLTAPTHPENQPQQ